MDDSIAAPIILTDHFGKENLAGLHDDSGT